MRKRNSIIISYGRYGWRVSTPSSRKLNAILVISLVVIVLLIRSI